MSLGELRPPTAEDPLLGQVVSDRYRVIRKLGEGGMGSVYLAEHVFIEKKVALKVLAPELARREDLAARFLQEARSASRIGHENVIDISDFGQSTDGFVYIAMEFLDGCDLGQAIREGGPMPWLRARRIVIQICKALRAAHAQGIVHRDMKPENIFLVRKEGEADFVKLLDFGIAKVMGTPGDNTPRLTRTGMIFGTPEYMAPEQAEGRDTDHRVDIYAAGCVIYHLLTGSTPFVADSFMAMLTKHLLEEPMAPSRRRPDLKILPQLDQLVLRALIKDRDKRWQSMDELMDAVSAIETSSGPVMAGTPTRRLGGAAQLDVTGSARLSDNVSPDLLDEPLDRSSAGAKRSPPVRGHVPLLIMAGVALGVMTALALFLGGKHTLPKPIASPLAAPAVVPDVPTTAVAPATPALGVPVGAARSAPGGSIPAAPRGGSRHPRRILDDGSDEVPRAARDKSVPSRRDPLPAATPGPAELKPFPVAP